MPVLSLGSELLICNFGSQPLFSQVFVHFSFEEVVVAEIEAL